MASNNNNNTCDKNEYRGVNWGDDETSALIKIWADGTIQAQLEGSRRNKAVFQKIGEKMQSKGFHRTGDQCRQKIKGLRQEYKKITDNNKKSGRGRKTCKFYDRLNDILGHRPNLTPVDSDEGTSDTDEARPCTPAPSTSVDDLSGEESANNHDDQESSDVSFANRSTSKPGKRRKTRVDQFQKCMEETFQKFAESQKTNMKSGSGSPTGSSLCHSPPPYIYIYIFCAIVKLV
uniref:Myb/SANT-like DNA-binding domain-containing protein n=1 Tax=Hippocampus comes TaxID=109280 RepID=A0A3Q2YRR0_HIPCM